MKSYIEAVIDDLEPCLFITSLKVSDLHQHDLKTLQTLLARAINHSYRHACMCGEVGIGQEQHNW